MAKRAPVTLGLLFLAAACGGSEPPPAVPPPPPAPAPVASVATVEHAPAPPPPAPEPAVEPAKPAAPTPIVHYAEGLNTPESVIYDEAQDRYLVSNINGKPGDADGNGYISDLSPDGKVTNAKFIAAGVNKVKLDAPKGLGIQGGTLYVSDLTVVRKFDLKTGAPQGQIAIPGATFLNDIAVGPDGKVYVSDSGVKAGKDGFAPTGSAAVHVIEKGKVKTLAKSKDLGGPNGLIVNDKGVWVNSLTTNEFYRLDEKGARQDINKLPGGGLDGFLALGDTFLVGSWQASVIFRGKPGDKFEVAIPDTAGAADFGYDTKRSRLLVPRLPTSVVDVYEVK